MRIVTKKSFSKTIWNVCIYLFIILIFLGIPMYSYSQTQYLIKDKEGLDFILNIDINGSIINGHTRDKALLDYITKAQYKAVKLLTPIKYPEIIRFNAKLKDGKFDGDYQALYNYHKIEGEIKDDSISYTLYDNGKYLKKYSGAIIKNYRKKDYIKLARDVVKFTEDSIYDTKIIQSKKWNNFKRKFISSAEKTYDDFEFQIGFFAFIRNIGFSHYYIVKNDTATTTDRIGNSTLKEIDKSTAMLKINSFDYEETKILKTLLDSIKQKSYKNLIIDLRDNPGGTVEPALLVGNFLTSKEIISGFFPNRRWYQDFNRYPNKNDIKYFDLIEDFHKDYNLKYGFYLSSKGTKNCFNGKVYILVNNMTGSACEALAISAKEHHLAKIIGEKTAGKLLFMSLAKLDKDIALIIPSYDFISYNGYRIEKKGIEPDIKSKKGKELETVLDIIKEDK